MSNSETPTTTVASDWLVSVTPSPRGDWQLPGGVRYNLTLHNGATPEDVTAALATLAAIAAVLVSAYDAPSAPTAHTGGSTLPAPQRQAPPPPDGADGEDVYGVGFIVAGGQFDVEIERASATATKGGKPQLALYRPGNQYPFAHVNENQFDAFHAITGVHGGDLRGETKFDAPIMLRFKLGKKKANSDKHYVDFVGAPTSKDAVTARVPDGPGWDAKTVLAHLSAAYEDRWTDDVLNGMLLRLGAAPTLPDEEVIRIFMEKVDAADKKAGTPDPKAPA